jgi:cell division protein FtsB
MTQRRTPSGQGPSRRPGQAGRSGGRTTGRPTTGIRVEPRVTVSRLPTSRTTRPVTTRRTAATGATKRTVATRPRAFTGRATVLTIVLVVLALAYTYPIRVYLAQESKIAQMEASQAAQRRTIDGLTEEVAKWHDDAYVKIQARDRLFYVERGETPLLVLYDPRGAAQDAGKNLPPPTPGRWYDTLWGSMAAANAKPRD